MKGLYQNTRASLVKFCIDFAKQMKDADVSELAYFNFDAHSEENELPDSDLIGLSNFAMNLTSPPIATVMIGLSTKGDVNLDRLEKLVGLLADQLLPNTSVNVADAGTGERKTVMKVMENSVSPATRAVQRPLKFVALTLGVAAGLG